MVSFSEAISNEPDPDEIIKHQEIILAEAARIAEKYQCTTNNVLENIVGAGTCLIDEQTREIYAFLRADKPSYQNAAFFGGKIEEGESAVVAAIRETFEESGQKINISLQDLETRKIIPIIELADTSISDQYPYGRFFVAYIVNLKKSDIDDSAIASHSEEGSRKWMNNEEFREETAFRYYVREVMRRYEKIMAGL